MAGENMGDISFSLTLKSRVEDETKKIISELNKVDATGKRAQQALEAIREAIRNIDGGKGGGNFEKLKAVMSGINKELAKFSSDDFFDGKKVQQLASVAQQMDRILLIMGEIGKSGGGVRIFPSETSKEVNDAEKAISKLASFMKELGNKGNEGAKLLGIDSIQNLRESIAELKKYQVLLDQIRSNGGTHPVTGITSTDVTKSAEYLAAIERAKESARGVKQAIADANVDAKIGVSIEKERAQLMKQDAKEIEAQNKALSDYAKRYMELQEAKRRADEKAAAEANKKSEQRTAQIERDMRKMSELYSILGVAKDKAEKVGMNGLALNVDTSKLEAKLKAAEDLMNRIFNANVKTLGLGGRKSSDDYATEVKNVKRALDEATQSQKELNRAQEQANKAAKREEEKRLAQETREAAKAAREAAQAEKQRQREMEVSRQRIQSMTRALDNLQEKRFTTKMLGLDTREADAKINRLKTQLIDLMNILNGLSMGDTSFLGRLGNIGNGREVQSANNIASIYDKVNKEAQKGIEIERKRQREVAATAAKVRGDMVSAFEQARKAASGVNSTVQDLKNLFLQGGLVYGTQQFLMSVIQTGGELERQHIALQSILGDMQNADTMFGQIKDLALKSPFTFSELNKDVKQLAAYGVEYDALYDTTKRLADMASGLGVSFERIALAFGQVQARGWLDGKELRQISYAGIPLLDKLSKMYTEREGQKVSTSEVKTRISSRQVSFEDVKSVFWDMTDAGGQFYNMQETLSNTLLGRYNKLKDAWEIMLSDFASGTSKSGQMLMGVLDILTSIVQGMHTLGPVLAAAFSGFALKKILTAQGGGLAAAYLGEKGRLANEYTRKLAQGQQLDGVERNILNTKNQITSADLRNLAASRQLTMADLDRLRVSGKITAEQYKIYRALVMQQTPVNTVSTSWKRLLVTIRGMSIGGLWSNFSTTALASFRLIGVGARALGATLWSAIGGLPGLIITGITTAVTYFMNASAELKSEMETVSNELKDRFKGISDVLRDNPAGDIISRGDLKEIDAAIEKYKEKIKEIAPYDYSSLVMEAEERKSHEDRLAFLSGELERLKKINQLTQDKLDDSNIYKGLKEKLGLMSGTYDGIQKLASYRTNIPEEQRFSTQYHKGNNGRIFENQAKMVVEELKKRFGDIEHNNTLLGAAKQAISSILAQMEVPQDKADAIRASVISALGLTDGWLKDEVAAKMTALIGETAPLIAAKIRSGQELTDAEREKVIALMKDARRQMELRYPFVEARLQELLKSSNFTAVIKLVVDRQDSFNDVEQVMAERLGKIPFNDETKKKFLKYLNSWGKSGSFYDANNAAKETIDKAYNNYSSAKKDGAPAEKLRKLRQEWEDAKTAAQHLLHYDYEGEGKKSNKPPKDKNQKDEVLERWQERLNAYKSARQAYQKYKQVMGEDAAKEAVEELYDNIAGLDLDKYEESIKALEKELSPTTAQRKKALTSLKRELADWRFSEIMKPEFERAAAAFREALENAVSRFDLYDELVDKSGDKAFAIKAFDENGQVWTDKSRNLAMEYAQRTGRNAKTDATATDAELEHLLKDINGDDKSYELIKKIKELLSNDYVTYLKKMAEARGDESYQALDEKLAGINAEYARMIEAAIQLGDSKAQRILASKQQAALSGAEYSNLKKSPEYATFFSKSIKQGATYLKQFSNLLKDKLNDALLKGGITAEEYASEIEKINDRMNEVGDGFGKFGGGGLNKLTSGLKDIGKQTSEDGAKQYESFKQAFNTAMAQNNVSGMMSASEGMQAGQSMMDGGASLMEGAGEMEGAIAIVDTIIHGINDIVQGMYDTFKEIKETADALGTDTDSDSWTDADTFFSSFSSASDSATKGWDSLKEGNIGGVVSGVVGSFTGWIKGFAQGHDQKLDNQIKVAERQEKLLQNISSNVSDIVNGTLGGIYNYKMSSYSRSGLEKTLEKYSAYETADKIMKKMGWGKVDYSSDTYEQTKKALETGEAYDVQLAALLAQRDEISDKIQAERDKKNSDSDKIADYEKEQEDLRLQIQNFTTSWLSTNYGVDLKDWASQLTDALVEAWATGEDAADAYFDTVNSLMKSLAKKIISQSILEANLQPVLDEFSSLLQDNNGKLDKTSLNGIWEKVMSGMDTAIDQTESFLDYVKSKGLDLSENGTLSTSNSIKSITEETADLLASYINAIRLDVSVNRANIQTIAQSVLSLPEMNTIARSQLAQMSQLVELATLRNEKLDALYDLMRATTTGTKKLYVA